jgi:gliding motility-associated-like protein
MPDGYVAHPALLTIKFTDMRKLILAILLLSLVLNTSAQEQRIWSFGFKGGLDFSGGAPSFHNTNLFPGDYSSASICNSSGQLQFYTNGFWVWNRDNEIMPELTGGVSGYTSVISPTVGYPPLMPWDGTYATQPTAIVGAPAHQGIYYLFSLGTSGTLFYSMIDMSLNGGKGGIMAGKKGLYLASGLTEKLTVVNGCNNIWVMVRAKAANQYKAFEVNDTGLITAPVISNIGSLPLNWYGQGVIKFSSDGSKMAAACNTGLTHKGGLEFYDFNRQTGILSNPLVLDSSSTLGNYFGACFSPDNSKLYATTSSFANAGTFYYGKVRQFDISLSTPAAITASNTIVFTDFVYAISRLGDLKRGEDDKIYFSSAEPANSTLHCINSPNIAGVTCNAMANIIAMPVGTATRGMPNDIAFILPPDSIFHNNNIAVCFKDSVILTADSGKHYLWDNGSTLRNRKVTTGGVYILRYINADCKYECDSIHVGFIKLPVVSSNSYSCPGKQQAMLWIKPQAGDTTTFSYAWKDANGNILQSQSGNHADTLSSIDTGIYFIHIATSTGCDTTLKLKVIALPVPVASYYVDSITCKGTFIDFVNTNDAPLWKWRFGDGNTSNHQSPSYSYDNTGVFSSSLIVTNIEGCSDTAYRDITVKSLDLFLEADKTLVNRVEIIRLQSSGSEAYTVTSWEPYSLFLNQSQIFQSVMMDTTRLFTVHGISEYGCKAEASVTVDVNPTVFIPNSFSPNGDGLNDRFRPVFSGQVFVRFFGIYNRFGQQVYNGQGSSALEGWDGTFNGQQSELGTYFYQIEMETNEEGHGKLLQDKIERNRASVPGLDFANKLPSDLSQYQFAFIDSVTDARMDEGTFGSLIKTYKPKGTSIIGIFHATKDGRFRGGQTFAHDADILIRIENGIAYAQGRYAPPGQINIAALNLEVKVS